MHEKELNKLGKLLREQLKGTRPDRVEVQKLKESWLNVYVKHNDIRYELLPRRRRGRLYELRNRPPNRPLPEGEIREIAPRGGLEGGPETEPEDENEPPPFQIETEPGESGSESQD